MKTSLLLVMGLLMVSVAVQAQEVDLKKHPGYINLDEIEIPDKAGEITDIDLGPALLQLLQLGKEEDDLKDGLAGILSIRVKSFEVEYGEAQKIRSIMDKYEKQLVKDNWVRLVRTKKGEEMANISMKFEGGKVVGFFLMSIEPGNEVSFVNIFGGGIDLESIKDFGLGLSDSTMNSIEKSLKKF